MSANRIELAARPGFGFGKVSMSGTERLYLWAMRDWEEAAHASWERTRPACPTRSLSHYSTANPPARSKVRP